VLDVIVRGGDLIDGTGAPRQRVDIGLRDGRVVEIGSIPTDAASVVDASGMVVTPGFVDVHTHFDAQVFWDSALTPSPLHGVTTVVAGNCGFTIAPLTSNRADGDYLMRMLARVEGMPLESLRDGVPWSWTSTAEYFASIDGNLGVNAAFMVGHSAIRRVVMGDDAARREATVDELGDMVRLLHEGLDAGGVGFSSSWARTHNDANGDMVPSRNAGRGELIELCRATGEHPGTSLEFIPMVGVFEPWATELMADMSVAAGRPLNWNVLTITAEDAALGLTKLGAGDVARARGGKVVALTVPMSFGLRLSFASGFLLDAIPGWEEPMASSNSSKLALLGDMSARNALNDAAQRPGHALSRLADWSTKVIFDVAADENQQYVGRTVGDIAREEGRAPWDVLCDIVVADELRTSFGTPSPVESHDDWVARVGIWRDSRAVIGASDAGAHLDLFATFNYPTVVLSEAVRKHNVLSLEEAVHLLSDVPARLYGLRDRGRVAIGGHADLVVLDPETVGSDDIAMRFDVPGGAGRLYAGATGVEYVFVNGELLVRGGSLTERRPGSLLRSGRDTATPELL
jgi:N-acyl-D-aspartate/D-glutamate deacylase